MLVAYVTADEVNQYVARQMADVRGVALHVLSFQDPRPDNRYDAVLYDLDSLSPERHPGLLVELVCHPLPWPAAVHSRNLEERQVVALRRYGINVFRGALVSQPAEICWPPMYPGGRRN
jgi:hypothetical protein